MQNNLFSTRIASSIQFLTGQGMEYLVIDDMVIAKFYDGNLVTSGPVGNSDVTVTAA